MPLVTSGVEHGNLRELALARMRDLGTACRDVRTREVGIVDIHTKVKPEQVRVPVPTSRHGPACAGVSLLRTDVRTHALAHATHARTHVRTRLDLRLSWCGETMLPMAAGKRFCRMKTRTVTYWCARAPSCVYMSTPWSQAGTAAGRRCAARSASCACASVATRRTGPSSWAAPRLCASCTCTSTPPLPPPARLGGMHARIITSWGAGRGRRYGSVVPIHSRDPTKFQHQVRVQSFHATVQPRAHSVVRYGPGGRGVGGQGFGVLLMEEAERIAREEHGSSKLAVISGMAPVLSSHSM
jgi:hypothetical protein